MDKTLLKMLENTNLDQKESMVFVALLNLGAATVSQIAETTGLSRASLYYTLEKLIQQNYVSEAAGTKIKKYIAADPVIFSNELSKAATEFKEMLPYLQSMRSRSKKPVVSYFNSEAGVMSVWSQIRRPKEAFYATSISKIAKHFPTELERWKQIYRNSAKKYSSYHLLSDSKIDREFGSILSLTDQNVQYLNRTEFAMDMVLFDNKIIFVNFEDEISATLIESESLYRSLKELYLLAYNNASVRTKSSDK